jgi:predicted outer membrane protein
MQRAKVAAAVEARKAAQAEGDSRKVKKFQEQLDGDELKLSKAIEDGIQAQKLQGDGNAPDATAKSIAAKFHDTLAEYLDVDRGNQVTDRNIFRCASEFFKTFFLSLFTRTVQIENSINLPQH